MLIIGAYVDDLLTLFSSESEMTELYAKIKSRFDFTPQKPLVDICGVEVQTTPGYIILSLVAYIVKMANTYLTGVQRSETVHTPADENLPKLVEAAMEQDPSSVDPSLLRSYRAIVGAILFAVTTVRADAAYAAGMLSRAMNKPTPELLAAAERVLQYLYCTREIGLHYSRKSAFNLSGMSDSDWQVRCSTSGYVFFLACAAISWLSKKQPTIAMSTAQSEICAASLAALESYFLASFYEQMFGRKITPIDLGIDSKAANDLSQDFVSNSRVRHFERRQLKIRELVDSGVIATNLIPTAENVADIFTKPLGRRQFQKLRKVLMNLPTA